MHILNYSNVQLLGITCYILVSGKLPFCGQQQEDTLRAIRSGKFKWPKDIHLSESCKHFISSLLCTNPHKRLNAKEALSHEWISQKGKASHTYFGALHLNHIQLFSTANKLQKVMINAVLMDMDKKEKQLLLKAVRDLNMNANKIINENDIINYILMHDEVKGLALSTFDDNMNDIESIDIDEFFDEINLAEMLSLSPKVQKKINENDEPNLNKGFVIICDEMKYDNDDDDKEDKLNELGVINQHKLNMFGFSSVSPYHSDIDSDSDESDEHFKIRSRAQSIVTPEFTECAKKISVEKFERIMLHADKEYDVDLLVTRLMPTNSGNIPFENINKFKGALHSEKSNKIILDDIVECGMNMTLTSIGSNKSNFN